MRRWDTHLKAQCSSPAFQALFIAGGEKRQVVNLEKAAACTGLPCLLQKHHQISNQLRMRKAGSAETPVKDTHNYIRRVKKRQ